MGTLGLGRSLFAGGALKLLAFRLIGNLGGIGHVNLFPWNVFEGSRREEGVALWYQGCVLSRTGERRLAG